MKTDENSTKDFFLVGTRDDPDGLMTYEVWAKAKMTNTQIDESVEWFRPLVKKEYPGSKGPFRIWIEDAYFDDKNKNA